MSLKLYSYWRSSCSWRVRICLALKQLECEIIPVHLVQDGGMQRKPEYRMLNPIGQVPTFFDGDIKITQSMAIMEYIDEKFKSQEPPLLPTDLYKKSQVRQICETINSGIQPLQNLIVLQKIGDTKVEWAHHWITTGFTALEKMLETTSGKYCVGDDITMADACLVPQPVVNLGHAFGASYKRVRSFEYFCGIEQKKFARGSEKNFITRWDYFAVMNAERFKVEMSSFPIISRINASLLEHQAFQVSSPQSQIDCPDKA